jgi:hypothetical protein
MPALKTNNDYRSYIRERTAAWTASRTANAIAHSAKVAKPSRASASAKSARQHPNRHSG